MADADLTFALPDGKTERRVRSALSRGVLAQRDACDGDRECSRRSESDVTPWPRPRHPAAEGDRRQRGSDHQVALEEAVGCGLAREDRGRYEQRSHQADREGCEGMRKGVLRPGELVHRHTIARTFGHTQGADARRSADMHVCRIRKKLRDAGGHALQVETVYGRGYLLRLATESANDELLQPAEWSV